MGLFSRIMRWSEDGIADGPPASPPASPNAILWLEEGPDRVSVVGSQYTESFQALVGNQAGDLHIDVTVTLTPEPHNRHDKYAIAAHVDGLPVGHVSAALDGMLSPILQRWLRERPGAAISAKGQINGRSATDCRITLSYDKRQFSDGHRSEPMLFVSPPADPTAVLWLPDGPNYMKVVGESKYPESFRKLVGSQTGYLHLDVVVTLTPEPTNRYDSNAVAAHIDGLPVGYLPREAAACYSPIFQRWLRDAPGAVIAVMGRINGPSATECGVQLFYVQGNDTQPQQGPVSDLVTALHYEPPNPVPPTLRDAIGPLGSALPFIVFLGWGGRSTLHVAGESYYLDSFKALVGDTPGEISKPVVATLSPVPNHPDDQNAVAVWIEGLQVGYLTRQDAARMFLRIKSWDRDAWRAGHAGVLVEAEARIKGAGPDQCGVYVLYDPNTLDLPIKSFDEDTPSALPTRRIMQARRRIAQKGKLTTRHFQYNDLESTLYRLRDEPGALDAYDDTVRQHHKEMTGRMRDSLIKEFGDLPHLPLYEQASIRWEKAHDYEQALWWAEAGLAVYGDDAGRPEITVDDLTKRAERLRAKIVKTTTAPATPKPDS